MLECFTSCEMRLCFSLSFSSPICTGKKNRYLYLFAYVCLCSFVLFLTFMDENGHIYICIYDHMTDILATDPINLSAVLGLLIFFGKGVCASCLFLE